MKFRALRIQNSQSFCMAYQQLPQAIQKKVDRQLAYLAADITHPGLRSKKMTDMKGIWEARIDSRYRFTFELSGGVVRLRTVGTHDIYQRP